MGVYMKSFCATEYHPRLAVIHNVAKMRITLSNRARDKRTNKARFLDQVHAHRLVSDVTLCAQWSIVVHSRDHIFSECPYCVRESVVQIIKLPLEKRVSAIAWDNAKPRIRMMFNTASYKRPKRSDGEKYTLVHHSVCAY